MRNYWIGVVSRSHVEVGVKGGFVQLNHGKKAPVQRLKAGDMLAMYSPRESYPDGAALQAFTAIGTIRSGEVYQVEMSPEFKPYRVDVEFFACLNAPIKPLVERLSFIKSKTHWGAAFRFGYIKVPEADFALIADAMKPTPSAQNTA
jgi:predicted RNA-binding protein